MESAQSEGEKIALVTGGNRGLGFAWCRQLGKMGFTILLTARDLEKAQKSAEVLQAEGIEVHAFHWT